MNIASIKIGDVLTFTEKFKIKYNKKYDGDLTNQEMIVKEKGINSIIVKYIERNKIITQPIYSDNGIIDYLEIKHEIII